MRETYEIKVEGPGRARASLSYSTPEEAEPYPGGWWVDWLTAPPQARGSGVGRRLLDAVCQDADAEGITLHLCASACAGMSQEALVAWYERRGFERTGQDHEGHHGPIMIRRPRGDQ